jgi:type II secretory pathway pseudopilin PulG
MVEVIVGMVLFCIIASTVTAAMIPMLRNYARAADLAEANSLLDTAANYIINDLMKATEPLTPGSAADTISIQIKTNNRTYSVDGEGVLLRSSDGGVPVPVLSKDFYKRKSVTFSYAVDTSNGIAYDITVEIWSDQFDRILAERTYAVKPIVLQNP